MGKRRAACGAAAPGMRKQPTLACSEIDEVTYFDSTKHNKASLVSFSDSDQILLYRYPVVENQIQ